MASRKETLSVISIPVHCYKIGEKYFVVHPDTGTLYEIGTGNNMTVEENNAYNNRFMPKNI